MHVDGGTDAGGNIRIEMARVIFNILGKVWSAKNISKSTKMGQQHG